MASTPISSVAPDFNSLYGALQKKLEQKRTWLDLLPTGVGSTVLDLFAGSHVTNQLYLDVSFREAFLPTAVRDSSIFAGTRMLGVNIARKSPASCTVELVNHGLTTKYVPPYSQFELNGRKFFNRIQYVVPPGQGIANVALYSGEVKTKQFDLSNETSLALKEFFLGEAGFGVSTQDILVYTRNENTGNTNIWEVTDKALFEHNATEKVYFESTARDGDVSLYFGDGQYGLSLSNDEELHIRYIVTDGSVGNNGMPGILVRTIGDNELKGETLTSIAGGADEKSSLYYKLFAPNMFRTKRRVISSSDFRATIMSYPGVADVSIMGQREIAPNDPRWMNQVRVCVLPEEADTFGGANPNPKSAQWQQFLDWLEPKRHRAYAIQTWNPTKIYVNVRVKVAILPSADANEIKLVSTENILKLFQKKPGSLGRRLSKSDIVEVLRKIEGVDYIELAEPTDEIIPPDHNEYVVLDGAPHVDVVYSERTLGVKGVY